MDIWAEKISYRTSAEQVRKLFQNGQLGHAETPPKVFGTLPGQFTSTLGRKAVIRSLLVPSQRKPLRPFAMTTKISEL